MTNHLPVLIVVIPLSVAVILPLLALASHFIARVAVFTTLIVVCLCSAAALMHALQHGPWHYQLGGWAPPWGVEYVIDPLSGAIATLIACMALLVAVYAGPHMSGMSAGRSGTFYSLFLLLVTGLLGIVVTGDMFNLYVFLEISSLAAYGLLASGGIRATVATFRYLIVGTIAATFYLLGVGYLYALTGTLNMADLATRIPSIMDSSVFIVAVSFIVVGLAIKAALFPLHGWLPDAYTYAPAPVVGFIAAVMTKVSAYVLFRVLYFVLRPEGAAGQALMLLGWASAIAVLAGSLLAIAQQDVRRMLAYSSIGQMGYITLGLAIGNTAAITGALLHILNHAIMKGCLFMIVGGIQWRTGTCRIDDFIGLSRRMPLTMLAFVVAALSMIGLPPTAGFFSKWYLISGALQAGAWYFVIPLVGSSLLSAVYFFRIIETSFLKQPDTSANPVESRLQASRHELPLPMLTPIIILASAVLIVGFLNHTIVSHVIQFALPKQVL
ncbi:MAG: monovalent cation/H+ antiporter subunit D family protein [bacterium]|nr:monovalent cation/H+ antiporter subunit D family protein [bacterium]